MLLFTLATVLCLHSSVCGAEVRQLCCLLKTEESHLTINVMHMQSQVGASDCGCFAIDCATALCHGQNP